MLNSLKSIARRVRARFYHQLRPANVCMLHIGRCGSTVLGNVLHQHPDVYWGGETFLKKTKLFDVYDTNDPWKVLLLKSAMAKRRLFGFEIKGHPTQHPANIGETLPGTIAGAHRFGCRHFILLTRVHLLRRYVSYLVGAKRKRWNYNRADTVEMVRVRVPIKSTDGQIGVLKFIERFDGIVERWKALIPDDCRTLELEYARDILGDPRKAYTQVAEWLGLDAFRPTVNIRKVETEPLDAVVTNWNEVCEVLEDTSYAWMLTDETVELT